MKRFICLFMALLISTFLLAAGKWEHCRAAEIDRAETVTTEPTEPEKTLEPMDKLPDNRGEDH